MVKYASFVDTHSRGSERLSKFIAAGHEPVYSARWPQQALEATSLIQLDPESCDVALIGANAGEQTNAQFGYSVTRVLMKELPNLPRIWIAHKPIDFYDGDNPDLNFRPEWFADMVLPDQIEPWLAMGGLERAIEAGNPAA